MKMRHEQFLRSIKHTHFETLIILLSTIIMLLDAFNIINLIPGTILICWMIYPVALHCRGTENEWALLLWLAIIIILFVNKSIPIDIVIIAVIIYIAAKCVRGETSW